MITLLTENDTIIVGMSGGVDSSVTALLLKQQGYDVQGLFMKNWEEDDTADYCSATEDLRDARAVCEHLGLPLHTVNFSADYWDNVFEAFLREYQAGRTPNPDILCNREIKFKVFLEHAQRLGGKVIATGHYVRARYHNGGYELLKGTDANKDQSYFLHALNQYQLANSIFPVGELHKSAVRQLAEQFNLTTSAKKDSTGICFIGERPFKDFLQRFVPPNKGEMVTPAGQVVGEHDGVMYYTIGQRQGLQIGGQKNGSGEPWFVADKDIANNQLIVVQGHQHPALFHQRLTAVQVNWIAATQPVFPLSCKAKTRYRQTEQPCTVVRHTEDVYTVTFAEPQRAITPGQAIVFYQGEVCLGGGVIDQRYA